MNKYIWIGCLSILMLTGCGESKEEEQARKAKEFLIAKYGDPEDHAKREKLYDECYNKNVRSYSEIRDEAIRISGNNNMASVAFNDAFKPMMRARHVEKAKCDQIRAGN
ncbi:MAG: hypothetical protein ACHQAX_05825 [Gammaproteobacteria bacterium]